MERFLVVDRSLGGNERGKEGGKADEGKNAHDNQSGLAWMQPKHKHWHMLYSSEGRIDTR